MSGRTRGPLAFGLGCAGAQHPLSPALPSLSWLIACWLLKGHRFICEVGTARRGGPARRGGGHITPQQVLASSPSAGPRGLPVAEWVETRLRVRCLSPGGTVLSLPGARAPAAPPVTEPLPSPASLGRRRSTPGC